MTFGAQFNPVKSEACRESENMNTVDEKQSKEGDSKDSMLAKEPLVRKRKRENIMGVEEKDGREVKQRRNVGPHDSKSYSENVKLSPKKKKGHDRNPKRNKQKDLTKAEHSRKVLSSTVVPKSDYQNGLKDVIPKKGMLIELCDKESIWSSGFIVHVEGKDKPDITIRYTGWDAQWDEVVSWKNTKRLARMNYFTKRCLCLVELISTKKGKALWPCIVHLRMPNPRADEIDRKQAESSLRAEDNIFLEPYGIKEEYLPKYIMNKIMNGGIWLSVKKVRPWRRSDEVSFKYKNFDEAYNLATRDNRITHLFPRNAFQFGSLLQRMYRVSVLDKAKYSKVFPMGDFFSSSKSPDVAEGSVLADSDEMESEEQSEESMEQPLEPYNFTYASNKPFTKILPTAKIDGPIYPGTCVKRLSKTGEWNASVDIDGSRISIGAYPTQSQAVDAIKGEIDQSTMTKNEGETRGRVRDMNAVSLEAVVTAEKSVKGSSNTFSIQKWTAERVERNAYLSEEQRNKNRERFLELKRLRWKNRFCDKAKDNKRKESPKKLDLETLVLPV